MTDDKRSEREIIAEAYSDEARANWKAPVQVGRGGRMHIPWDIHLEAYEAYCKKWGHQTALIDLTGRGCRGGFGTEELDGFVPGWRDRVTAFGKMQAQLAMMEPMRKLLQDVLDCQMVGPPYRGWGVSRLSRVADDIRETLGQPRIIPPMSDEQREAFKALITIETKGTDQ